MSKTRFSLAAVAIGLTFLARAAYAQDHLECYKIKDLAPKVPYTADLAGLNAEPGCTVKVPAKLLCVDTTKTNVVPPPPGAPAGPPAGRFACYKVKCPKTTHAFDTLTDQFGTRQVQPKTSSLLCAPAQFPVPPPTTTTTTVTTTTTLPNTVCSDGVDNDGDGLKDWPNDPGCVSVYDVDETDDCPAGPNCPACGNGTDDDGDTFTDYPSDPGCSAASDPTEGITACSDGTDNDGDGKSDYPNDPGCTSLADVDESDSCPVTCPACGNGIDDDLDTFTDYPADSGCSAASDTSE